MNQVSTDDYRGISINPVISKLFELCLLDLFGKYLFTSSLQFGFKAKTGCNQARYAVRKTIEFFIDRNSTVNMCALDLKRAFDKMNKYALFIKLMQRNCPIVLINLLECWYSKIINSVKWGECFSSFVRLKTGVRQGGIISPALFSVFIDDVLVSLKNLGWDVTFIIKVLIPLCMQMICYYYQF